MKSLEFLPIDDAEEKPKRRGRPPKYDKPRPGQPRAKDTPLAYMLRVMNDPEATQARRDKMARDALPYCHAKKSEWAPPRQNGVKDQRQEAAETAGRGSKWGNRLHIA